MIRMIHRKMDDIITNKRKQKPECRSWGRAKERRHRKADYLLESSCPQIFILLYIRHYSGSRNVFVDIFVDDFIIISCELKARRSGDGGQREREKDLNAFSIISAPVERNCEGHCSRPIPLSRVIDQLRCYNEMVSPVIVERKLNKKVNNTYL